MRVVILCLLLVLLWFSAGYSWGSGWPGILATMAVRSPWLILCPSLVIVCSTPRFRLLGKAVCAALFLTLYFSSSFIFGLGLLLRFEVLSSNLLSVHRTERWEFEFRRMDGTIIHQRTGTGHNTPYIECSSDPGFTPSIKASSQYRSPPFTFAWRLSGWQPQSRHAASAKASKNSSDSGRRGIILIPQRIAIIQRFQTGDQESPPPARIFALRCAASDFFVSSFSLASVALRPTSSSMRSGQK